MPLTKNKRIIIDVALILIFGLISLAWFKDNLLITGGDFDFPLSPQYTIERHLSLWDEKLDGGYYSSRNIIQLPYQFFVYFLSKIGLSLVTIQKSLFYLLFVASGLSMYCLVTFLVDTPYKSVTGLLSGVFYMANPFHATFTWAQLILNIFMFPFLPLLILFYIKSIQSFSFANVIGLVVVFFLMTPAFSNPVLVVTAWILLFFFFLYFIVTNWKDKNVIKQSVYTTIVVIIVFLLINFWWILPLLSSIFEEYTAASQATIGFSNIDVLKLNSRDTSFLNIFRLLGHWGLYADFMGDPYVPWAKKYQSPLLMLISFIIPVIVFSLLLFKKKGHYRYYSLYFCLLSLIGLFLIKGTHPPFESPSLLIYTKIPFFDSFRNQYEKFGILVVLSYSFLFGLSLSELLSFFRNKIKLKVKVNYINAIFVGLVSMLLILYQYPFWSGKLIFDGGAILRSYHMKVPKYYEQAGNWIKKNAENIRLLELPLSGLYGVILKWESGYQGVNPTWRLLHIPMLSTNYRNIVLMLLNESMKSNNELLNIEKMAAVMNVKKILLHNDINEDFVGVKLQDIKSFLLSQNGIHFIKSFGKLDFYEISDYYFRPHIYPSSNITVVSSGVDSLIPLTSTFYFDGYPALAFTDQQNAHSLRLLVGGQHKSVSQQSAVSGHILFANSNFNDMVINLAKAESLSVAGTRKSILVNFDKKRKNDFRVEDKGNFEIWVKNNQGLEEGLGLEVGIDGEDIESEEKIGNEKWIKFGEVRLDKGKHKIAIIPQQSTVDSYNKEELKQLIQGMEIVIASKETIEEYKNIISQRFSGYFFYVDKEKVENMLKDREKTEEVRLKGESPFKINTQQFYIPEDGSYSLKVLVKPKRDFSKSDFVVSSSSSSSSSSASLDAVSGWDIKALNTIYKQNISEDGMHIDAYFQGRGDVKEGIILTKKFSDVNIKERPYLAFSWEIEDSGVQEAEIDIKFTDSKSLFFRTKKMTLKVDNKQYVVNLFQKVKNIFGKKTVDDVIVKEIVLKFKKKDGVDLSDEKKRKIYKFVFKNIVFSKTQPILAGFEDKLSIYLPDRYYYFDEDGEMKTVDFLEQIPLYINDVYKLHMQRFIDLGENPVLSLNFSKPAIDSNGDNERRSFPDEWKVTLGIDFDGDEKEDEKIETFVPLAGAGGGKLLLTIRAYEDTKKRFPDKRNYNLLSVGISHPNDQDIFYQTVVTKRLIRYKEYMYKPSDFKVNACVLKVDNKTYKLPSDAVKRRDNDNWIEFSNVYLKKGNHILNVPENDKFKVEMVEMVEIKPEIKSQKSEVRSEEPPKIEFKKINPTRYIVNVKGAEGPFTLVFSESFHEGWKAYIRQKSEIRSQKSEEKQQTVEPWAALWSAWKDRGNRIEIKDHFVVNGYANGWIVPVKQDSGFQMPDSGIKGKNIGEDFQIVLEFKPQRLFEIGLIVSATTLLGCIGYLGYDWRRRKKRKIVEN